MRIVVVGGGISGLTVAYLARSAGHDVMCIDAGAVPGGLIHSQRIDGFLCEAGPQAMLSEAPDSTALLSVLGLQARAITAAPEAKRRFIYARGSLQPLPMTPRALLRSRLLSAAGKARLLCEPFIGRPKVGRTGADGRDSDDDAETVAAFGARRLGREAARTLLGTAVIGIYAADAETLSLPSAFPRLAAMEREHGGLFRGMLAARRAGKSAGQATSFPEGLAELPRTLARALGPEAMARGTVSAITSLSGGGDSGWRLTLDAEAGRTTVEAQAVVLAVGPEATADLLRPVAPSAAAALAAIPAAPIAVCCLGFRNATATTMGMDLAAYGFLVARGEGPRLLGCQYESSTFPGRAPPGGVLLRAIMGGLGPGFEPELVNASDEEIARRAVADLTTVAGLRREPDLVRVWKYPRGIPLYTPGHAARIAAVDAALRGHRGLFVIGHALRGVGVNESIRAATALAREQFATGGTAPPRR